MTGPTGLAAQGFSGEFNWREPGSTQRPLVGLVPGRPSLELAFLGLVTISSVGMSVAIAIAIFKYRLYDIDIIIRRTLVYGLLTAALALLYFASVALLQGILVLASGQQSAVAILLSTLAAAALFSRLRARIQRFIDRSFYRQKYDASRTLNRFAQTARDEVDLAVLTAELVDVVRETMQPEHISIWLKEPDWSDNAEKYTTPGLS